MDKNAIKKYAVWARRELISRISGRAAWYGITEDSCVDADADSIDGRVLSATEKKQRAAFITKVQREGYEQAVEEVAYTWFNRFCALRYMEVNGYLPSHIRVFTDDANEFKPQILDEAIHLEIEGLDKEEVLTYKVTNDSEGLYRYLLITQCNALSSILPGMFQKIEDYTELLLPENLLREGSVIERMIAEIPEEDWTDQVQIIGWLYQYYNAGKKDEVFSALKKNVKITKENIPAATQLFTPDWIVRYMVENSLGRLWVEGHPKEELKSGWKYYIEEAEQELEVEEQLDEIRKEHSLLIPEDIKIIDPCMGSGHILVYAFDVLMQIYKTQGYTKQDAVKSILENNLYGLDIDERAAQLSYFSVMMKARSYDKRFFSRNIQPHMYAIQESNNLSKKWLPIHGQMQALFDCMKNAKDYGSLIVTPDLDYNVLRCSALSRIQEIGQLDFEMDEMQQQLSEILSLIDVAEILSHKYDVVVTNPPYMGSSGMNSRLSKFVKEKYLDTKTDLFSCFIERGCELAKKNKYISMITMESWMFLSSFEKMRINIIKDKTVINMVHMPYLGKGGTSLGINFGTAAVIFENCKVLNYAAKFDCIRYYETDSEGIPPEFPVINERYKTASLDTFSIIPGSPVAYWVSENTIQAFNHSQLGEYGYPKQGFATGNNDKFLRFWNEVNIKKIGFSCRTRESAAISMRKWFPCNKGGSFRRWYGNNFYVANWENDGEEMANFPGSVIRNVNFYFQDGITWSSLSSGKLSMRYSPEGFIFESKGSVCFIKERKNICYLLGLFNTCVVTKMLEVLSPTLDYHEGPLSKVPVILDDTKKDKVNKYVIDNIILCKKDWDAFEISWDFETHPFVYWSKEIWDGTSIAATMDYYYGYLPKVYSPLELCWLLWQGECNDRYEKLKNNEEELNRIFIEIYGLQDELSPEEEDKDVTVRKGDLQRDIRSFLSYAVGCMFGRYSLDMDGLAYAGGEWDGSKYQTYQPDQDGILPICDDEYFTDDIVGRFVDFIRTVYGSDTLEENLQFIADALGGKGSSREVIRKYFLNDFFADHCKIYQKRPIYWLFDSGKKNGFKCLIYLHRYRPDTIARIRTDYVHEQQARYRTAIADLENRIETASTSDRIKLNKELKKVQEQADELHDYEEKIHHLADQYIDIDLDDGVKVNYAKFQDVLAKIK